MANHFKQFPLGTSVGASPHSVVSSLPTLADVRAYEEKEARIEAIMHVGYPRFMEHQFVGQLKEFYLAREGLESRECILVRGTNSLTLLLETLGSQCRPLLVEPENNLNLVWVEAANDRTYQDLKKYVQHTGIGVSSREAEDLLIKYGCKEKTEAFQESGFEGDSMQFVKQEIAQLSGAKETMIWSCAAGMNAFYAAFKSVQSYQSRQGRKRWLQLGWLYVDSGSILEKFLGEEESLEQCFDVSQTESILQAIKACGADLAAVVVECPSNPLIESCDLAKIAAAVRAEGGVFLIDPTIASLYSVDVLKHADIVATSLTKYAAHSADIMTGAVLVNHASPHAKELGVGIEKWHLKPYARDLARLACSMATAPQAIKQMQANAERLIKFMKAHPAVERVHATEEPFFEAIAKKGHTVVSLFSIVLKGSMERFYDSVTLMKGPSFGSTTTLLCPFMFLAHYDLVNSKRGQTKLREAGIEPDLIRIAVGTEPYADLESIFEAALSASLN